MARSPSPLTENGTEYQVSCVKIVFQVCLSHVRPRSPTKCESWSTSVQCIEHNARCYFGASESPLLCSQQLTLGWWRTLSFLSQPSQLIPLASYTFCSQERHQVSMRLHLSLVSWSLSVKKQILQQGSRRRRLWRRVPSSLEEVELAAGGDYIIPSYSNFSAEWDCLCTGSSITETFTLSSMENIEGAL